MKHPRIVLMANNIDEVGGAQRVVHVLAQGFTERGHEVDVVGVTPQPPVHEYPDQPSYNRRVLMSEVWPAGAPADVNAKELRRRLRAEARDRLAEIVGNGPPGIVITAQVWAMEIASGVDLSKWRTIGQYHGSFAAAALGRDLGRVLDSYSTCDATVFLTPDDARAWQQAGLNNTNAIANPLAFWPEHPVSGSARTVGCISRLSEEKGVHDVLEAWALIADTVPAWELLVVGDGPQRSSVEQRCASLPRVRLMPPVTDVQEVFAELGIFVLPSRTEGLPLALMEAMACGVPAVATDCSSGVRFLAGAESDPALELVPRGDVPALAAALRFLIEDETQRELLAQRARRRSAEFTIDQISEKWERLFADINR